MENSEKTTDHDNRKWLALVSAASTLIVILIPKCPLCAIAILSVFGISVNFDAGGFYPLTFVFILIGLAATVWRTRQKRNYNPLYLAAFASVLILTGKFHFDSTAIFYTGVVLFFAAVLWSYYLSAAPKCAAHCK